MKSSDSFYFLTAKTR